MLMLPLTLTLALALSVLKVFGTTVGVLYKARYNESMNWNVLGFAKLMDLLQALPGIYMEKDGSVLRIDRAVPPDAGKVKGKDSKEKKGKEKEIKKETKKEATKKEKKEQVRYSQVLRTLLHILTIFCVSCVCTYGSSSSSSSGSSNSNSLPRRCQRSISNTQRTRSTRLALLQQRSRCKPTSRNGTWLPRYGLGRRFHSPISVVRVPRLPAPILACARSNSQTNRAICLAGG